MIHSNESRSSKPSASFGSFGCEHVGTKVKTGISLPELLVAVTILGIAIGPLLGLLFLGRRGTLDQETGVIAMSVSMLLLEQTAAWSIDSVQAELPSSFRNRPIFGTPGAISIEDIPADEIEKEQLIERYSRFRASRHYQRVPGEHQLFRAIVQVNWFENGEQKKVELRRLLTISPSERIFRL